jgi:hypothetical protein
MTLGEGIDGGGGIGGGGGNGAAKNVSRKTEKSNQRSFIDLPFGVIAFSCKIFPPRLLVFSTTNAELIPC